MQISLPQLQAHLQKGLRSLYMVQGDEVLLVQEALDVIRAHARAQGYTDRSVHTMQGAHPDWSAVMASFASMSLFSERQLVEVRIPQGKPGKEGGAVLVRLAEQAHALEGTLTLISLPKLDKATRAASWFAALETHGVSLTVEAVDRRSLPAWIAQRLKLQGQHVEAGERGQQALQFFADRVEGNLLAAHQEIQKLSLLHGTGELSLEQIEQAVLNVARYDVFKLSEAVLGGNLVRIQRMLDGLRAVGESPVLIHWTLAEEIRSIRRIQEAMSTGKPMPMALKENRVWGTKEMLMQRVLPRINEEQSLHLLESASQADGVIKGLKHAFWPEEPWDAVYQLAMQLGEACRVGGGVIRKA